MHAPTPSPHPLLDALPDGIAVIQDGCARYVNQTTATLLGRPAAELIGGHIDEVLPAERLEAIMALHLARLRGETVREHYEVPLLSADGRVTRVELRVRLITWHHQPATLVQISDSSERQRLQTLFSDIVQATASCGGQDLFELVVASLAHWLETDLVLLEQFTEDGGRYLACHRDGAAVAADTLDLPTDPAPCDHILDGHPAHFRNDGAHRCCGAAAQACAAVGALLIPITNTGGTTIAMLAAYSRQALDLPPFAEDLLAIVAARLALELERIARQQRLHEHQERAIRGDRLRSLGEMASGMAHEFLQPLSIIRGSAEHLQIARERNWQLTPAEEDHRLAMIVDQADRMSDLIEHLRQFAQQADAVEIMPVDLVAVVQAALRVCSAQLINHGIICTLDSEPAQLMVYGNPFGLEEMLMNLISNARDAVTTAARGDPAQITIGLTDLGTQAVLTVADNGPGIDPSLRQRVLEPFYTDKGPDRGAGLGLTTAHRIAQNCGGDLSIGRSASGGCLISITLPRCTSNDA